MSGSKQRNNKRSAFPVFMSLSSLVDYLSDDQAGKLLRAMFLYAETGQEPDLGNDTGLNMAFAFFKRCDDENLQKWNETREKRKLAAETRWKDKEGESTDNPVPGEENLPFN